MTSKRKLRRVRGRRAAALITELRRQVRALSGKPGRQWTELAERRAEDFLRRVFGKYEFSHELHRAIVQYTAGEIAKVRGEQIAKAIFTHDPQFRMHAHLMDLILAASLADIRGPHVTIPFDVAVPTIEVRVEIPPVYLVQRFNS